jgi:hypothetical protein
VVPSHARYARAKPARESGVLPPEGRASLSPAHGNSEKFRGDPDQADASAVPPRRHWFDPGSARVPVVDSLTQPSDARFAIAGWRITAASFRERSTALKRPAQKNSPPLCSLCHGLRGDGGPGSALKGTARGAIVARGCGTGALSSRAQRIARATDDCGGGAVRCHGFCCLLALRRPIVGGSRAERKFFGLRFSTAGWANAPARDAGSITIECP